MNEVIWIILALLVGVILGIFFFGGLWFTVRKATQIKIPALWFFGSLTLRLMVVLTGFYFVGMGDLIRMLVCLSGFILARFLVIRFTKRIDSKQKQITHGA
ncbi:ATP synthase subunit I [Algoriphagus sp. SE2]|uniref:ATP synthase subunit I n=1 Tax=Algoriphagus sp. SE2 TaxID=3141536 RepID=UPI0031CCE31C